MAIIPTNTIITENNFFYFNIWPWDFGSVTSVTSNKEAILSIENTNFLAIDHHLKSKKPIQLDI